ncbi:AAA family ATPase [Ferdinandcohnia sp. Marseille-Q9671]
MRIIGIEVYGYGKLENVEIGNISNLQVFYGPNEAGKSTLMSFIHSILFGFPTKQQNEQRYIPKSGAKYGGKLIVQTENYGTISIERLPGKATGDLTVYLPDGTVRGDDFITELFQGMDKHLYRNIYSFNLHGLQGVHNLSGEDVGRYLFSAGAVGTDALLELENKLTKEMDAIFKANGKKPPLNKELITLKEEHLKVIKWQENNGEYQQLLQQQRTIENELADHDDRKQVLQASSKKAERLQSIQPLVEEYQILETRIGSLPSYEPYPDDGLKRFEQLQAQIMPYEAQLTATCDELEKLKEQKLSIQVSVQYLENEQDILELVENKSLFIEKKNRCNLLMKELQQVEEELEQLKNRINVSLPESDILEMDSSIAAKDQFSEIVAGAERTKQHKHFLDDSFAQAKRALESSEEKIEDLRKRVLSTEERKLLEKTQKIETTKDSLYMEKEYLEDEVKKIDQKVNRIKAKESRNKAKIITLFYGIGIVAILASIYFYLSQEWVLGGFLTILAIFMLPIGKIVSSHFSSSIADELLADKEEIFKKLDSIQDQLLHRESTNVEEVTKKLLRDQHVRQQIEIEQATLLQYERAYEKVVAGFEEWEGTRYMLEEKAARLKQRYGLSTEISNERLVDAFQILEAIKEKTVRKKKIAEEWSEIQTEIRMFQDSINKVGKRLNKIEQGPRINIDQLALRLQEEKRKYEQLVQIEDKEKEVAQQISHYSKTIAHLQNECQLLWDIAMVTNEEEYREKGQANGTAKELRNRIDLLNAQLSRYGDLAQKCNLETNYQIWIEEITHEMNQLHASETNLRNQLSAIHHRIHELEEGGTYADLLHSFEGNKSVVRDYSKKWATLAIAKDILSKTVTQYRKLRLPMVIERAEKYFSILTEKQYHRIYLDNEVDGFLVEDNKGIRYNPDELSQATSEQLYISLRFSLANTMHPKQSFPFIIDDSFVNFDSQRLTSAISLIKEVAKENQVLLFTCHHHVVEGFEDAEPIKLGSEEIRENQKSVL